MVKSNYHGVDAVGSKFSFLYKKKSGIKRKVFVVVISNVYNLKLVLAKLLVLANVFISWFFVAAMIFK